MYFIIMEKKRFELLPSCCKHEWLTIILFPLYFYNLIIWFFFNFRLLCSSLLNINKRVLPDSNRYHPKWRLGTLPIKLRTLLCLAPAKGNVRPFGTFGALAQTAGYAVYFYINKWTLNTRARRFEHLPMILKINILPLYYALYIRSVGTCFTLIHSSIPRWKFI